MIKTILIDDDESNLNTLKALLNKYCKNVDVIATCTTIVEAEKTINNNKVELVFLDIELNNESGFDLLKIFRNPSFQVEFTTAHEQYALKAIKSSCLEYLLKPIDYRELIYTIDKYQSISNIQQSEKINVLLDNTNDRKYSISKIAVPISDGFIFLNINDIQYCQADMNYTKIILLNGNSVLSTKNLKEFEELLNQENFFRCHKSWLINLNYIKRYSKTDGNRVQMSNEVWIDISFRKKDDFLKIFKRE